MTISTFVHDGNTLAGAAAPCGGVVPDLTKRVIRAATLCNTTAAAVAVSVNLVPKGGAADATNAVISARPLAAGETYTCPELINQGVNAGGAVYASGAGVTFKYTATDIING